MNELASIYIQQSTSFLPVQQKIRVGTCVLCGFDGIVGSLIFQLMHAVSN